MNGPLPWFASRIRPTRPLARVAISVGWGWVVLLALAPLPAIAQAWTQPTPAFRAKAQKLQIAPPPPAALPEARRPRRADFKQRSASAEVQHVAHWALVSGDNGGMPYLIIDKVNAEVFVFDSAGNLEGAEPALLGMTPGDRAAPDIGKQKLSSMRPEDRITPAGRYVASLAHDLHGQDILWIDYASALALHRVVPGTPAERRADRLLSATSDDNRISYGCINVPVTFFENVVSAVFSKSSGIVYILPETGPASDLFGSYDVALETRVGTVSP